MAKKGVPRHNGGGAKNNEGRGGCKTPLKTRKGRK